ncbi:hypothetical protein [Photobacterium leiognathi]|uniref:hypothetical protein n=1 Tax=Photobacterium leiognathi TaxID=553611 RepID=UPI002980A3C7|nr:hypothetical protein [Photobacterium leiognathi]
MSQDQSHDESSQTKKKFNIGNALPVAALCLAIASGGYSFINQLSTDKTLGEHNTKLDSLKSKAQALSMDFEQLNSDENGFDGDAFKAEIVGSLQSQIQQSEAGVRADLMKKITLVEQKAQNIDIDKLLANVDLGGDGSQLIEINKRIDDIVDSQGDIRFELQSTKAIAMRSERMIKNYQSEMDQMEAQIAKISLSSAANYVGGKPLNRLPEFNVLSVVPQGKHKIVVVRTPDKSGNKFNTITLTNNELFTSKIGKHVVKDVVIDPKNETAKIITKDGFFIDSVRDKMTPALLAKYKKKPSKKVTKVAAKKRSSTKTVAKAKTKKETRLAIGDWEVITRFPETNSALVINTNSGETKQLKKSDVLKGYGRVVNVDSRTGRVNLDGYYIQGIDL